MPWEEISFGILPCEFSWALGCILCTASPPYSGNLLSWQCFRKHNPCWNYLVKILWASGVGLREGQAWAAACRWQWSRAGIRSQAGCPVCLCSLGRESPALASSPYWNFHQRYFAPTSLGGWSERSSFFASCLHYVRAMQCIRSCHAFINAARLVGLVACNWADRAGLK